MPYPFASKFNDDCISSVYHLNSTHSIHLLSGALKDPLRVIEIGYRCQDEFVRVNSQS